MYLYSCVFELTVTKLAGVLIGRVCPVGKGCSWQMAQYCREK